MKRRLTTFHHRAQDWLDRTVNRPEPKPLVLGPRPPEDTTAIRAVRHSLRLMTRPFDWKLDSPEVL